MAIFITSEVTAIYRAYEQPHDWINVKARLCANFTRNALKESTTARFLDKLTAGLV